MRLSTADRSAYYSILLLPMSLSTACLEIGVAHAPCMATQSAPAAQPLRSAAPTSSGSCTYLLRVMVRVRVWVWVRVG